MVQFDSAGPLNPTPSEMDFHLNHLKANPIKGGGFKIK